jgi:hypothetical protein
MADVAAVLKDPKFQGLPVEERRKVLTSIDSNFGGLAAAEQDKVLGVTAAAHESPDALARWRKDHPTLNVPLDFIEGIGANALSLVRGASQIAHHVVPGIPELPAEYATPPATAAGKAGEITGMVTTPVPGGAASKTAGWGVRALRAALRGGAGAALSPVDDSKSNDFVSEKLKQVGTGAVLGPVVEGAVAAGGKVAAKVINARRSGIPDEAKELIEAGKKHGVRLTYGDISRNPSVQKAEVTMESLPVVGMSGERAAQQAEAKAAATNLAESRYQKFLDTDPGLINDIEAAAKAGDVRARNLIDQLKNAGRDPDKVLQSSIGLGDFRTRQEAEHLYDQVEALVKEHKLPHVPMTTTQKALDKAIAEAEASKIPDRGLIGLLKDIKAGISAKPGARPANPFPAGTVNARQFDARPVKNIPAKNDYGAIRQLRSDLGNRIQTYMENENGIIGEKGVGQLQAVKNAIEDDLTAFTSKSGVSEVQDAARVADEFYKRARVPYKDAMLAAAAKDKEPDQIFQRFIQQGKGDRAERFYRALDPKGQEAVRHKIVATAVQKATNDSTGVFSPQKYFTQMNKLKDATRVFFQGAGEEEIDGFNNLMAHVTRAGQYAENPPTGQRLASGLVTAGTILNPVMGARVAAVAAASKYLFTTDAGKKFLLASSKLPPGSLKMASLVRSLERQLPVAASRAATQPEDQE